ncbi:hypothetical protein [Xanthomonas nasturtii]|uniref:Lipoprotein n=1 Tax=Xanthomonas nasturtii TaxID=1843581 RepID=A0ABT0LR15_9XANT|nr:hypothetical protein [Xanthomonas nasturtii]MCL1551795.1 hypothetical protein [Xanthomonas nasturtii]MCL1556018.1 hypothetical protein [Xanthomonas nasturtii]
MLAALSLGGCAGLCGAAPDMPPPLADRGPPPNADALAALQACAQEQDIALARPHAAGAEHAAPDRQLDRAIFDGCMARKGMAPPPHAGDASALNPRNRM